MFRLLFLLFLTVPLLEIYLLIAVGSHIGAPATIVLILFTAALGVILLRIQGLKTLQNIRQSLDRGELPAIILLEGLILLIAGVLLLTPGFFTDFIGFLCLVPPWRTRLASRILRHIAKNMTDNQIVKENPVTLEGEYWDNK